MQSAWSSGRPAWTQKLRVKLPAGTLPTAVIVLLLVVTIGNSTVSAQWVPGSEGLTNLALVAALLMGGLALARAPWPVALAAGIVLAPVAAYLAAQGTLARAHPEDPTDPVGVLGAWLGRVSSGEAANDVAFYLYLLCLLFWVVGGWLSWCALRWRQPLLGLAPGAAAFATNILNFPTDQNEYMFFFLVATLSLLLWTTYVRSLESAARRRVKLSGDARWDFWESGVIVAAAVVILGIFLPPLSNSDRTVDIENGGFRGWAELQQRLDHPVAFGRGPSSGLSTGFASLVQLAGPIHKTSGLVFTYTIEGTFGGPRYFRGYNLVSTSTGSGGPAWRYSQQASAPVAVPKNTAPAYAETYRLEGTGTLKMQMLKPPDAAPDVLFYPGTLLKVDRAAAARSSRASQSTPGATPTDRLDTIDRLSVPGQMSGGYTVTVAYSNATADDLRAAGTDYPDWLEPYRNFGGLYRGAAGADVPPLTGNSYRSQATLQDVRNLALKVTEGKGNPYDRVLAIETYLRSSYTYTLTPTVAPRNADPLEYFLFTSKEGYCEYFASAMGDMLRSLGIPVRLVNGYGPGNFDEKLGRYVVRESDAHTWVEAYFPKYGWLPFEPTPDGTYFPIPRGNLAAVCAPDSEVCNPDALGAQQGADANARPDKGALDTGDLGAAGGGLGRSPVPGGLPGVLAFVVVLLAATWVAVSRYLRPRTVSGVWKRVSFLSGLAGVRAQVGDTPLEFGARLAREFPEAAGPARELAEKFAVAAYAPREVASGTRTAILATWDELRPILLRRARSRLRVAS